MIKHMLQKITIRNFKAIQDLTVEFTPLTVLIGENACGKTTILQAIEFLSSAASRDIPEYLKEKDWRFAELKSQYGDGANKPIEFETVFIFDGVQVEWFLHIDFIDNKWHIREQINRNDEGIVSYSKMPIMQDMLITKGIPNPFKEIPLQSSLLKIIDNIVEEYKLGDEIIINKVNFKSLLLLKDFLSATNNYGLLSVDKMRAGKNDGITFNIGAGGHVLFLYIDSLEDDEKEKLIQKLSMLLGIDLNIKVYHRQNKAELVIEEKHNGSWIRINDQHISDGILRLIALVAISLGKCKALLSTENGFLLTTETGAAILAGSMQKEKGIILLDEIENGINPYKTEQVISIYHELVEKQGLQVLLTTHSPVMLNDFDPDEIVYLWKDKNGFVHSKKFFATEDMKDTLEFLNPGEIWLNYSKEELLKRMNGYTGADKK